MKFCLQAEKDRRGEKVGYILRKLAYFLGNLKVSPKNKHKNINSWNTNVSGYSQTVIN